MGYGMAPPSLFRRIGVLGLGAVFLLDSKAKQWWAAWKDWPRKRRCGMDCDVAFPKRLSITFNYLSCQEWTSCNLICTCIFRPVRQHNHELQFYVFISFASFTMEKLKRRADSSPSILRTGLNKKVDEGDFQAVLKKACARAVVWICLWDPMRKADLQRTQTGTKSDQTHAEVDSLGPVRQYIEHLAAGRRGDERRFNAAKLRAQRNGPYERASRTVCEIMLETPGNSKNLKKKIEKGYITKGATAKIW